MNNMALRLKPLLRWSIVILALLGIVLNLVVSGTNPLFPSLGNANSFLFFTIQSNLIVFVWYIISLYTHYTNRTSKYLKPVYKGAMTSYITLTFLVFLTILEPIYQPTGLHLISSVLLHYVVPFLVIVDWVLFEETKSYQYRFIFLWLTYPLGYMVYGLLIALIFEKYLYPFFNISQFGFLIIPFILVLTLVYFIISYTYIVLNKRMHKRRKV